MKNKITTIALFTSLITLMILIWPLFNDNAMRMKHWVLLTVFTANMQILIEKYFRDK